MGFKRNLKKGFDSAQVDKLWNRFLKTIDVRLSGVEVQSLYNFYLIIISFLEWIFTTV